MYSHCFIFKWKTIISWLNGKHYLKEIRFSRKKIYAYLHFLDFQFEDLVLNGYPIDRLLLLIKYIYIIKQENIRYKLVGSVLSTTTRSDVRSNWEPIGAIMIVLCLWEPTSRTSLTCYKKKTAKFLHENKMMEDHFIYTGSEWTGWKN